MFQTRTCARLPESEKIHYTKRGYNNRGRSEEAQGKLDNVRFVYSRKSISARMLLRARGDLDSNLQVVIRRHMCVYVRGWLIVTLLLRGPLMRKAALMAGIFWVIIKFRRW